MKDDDEDKPKTGRKKDLSKPAASRGKKSEVWVHLSSIHRLSMPTCHSVWVVEAREGGQLTRVIPPDHMGAHMA